LKTKIGVFGLLVILLVSCSPKINVQSLETKAENEYKAKQYTEAIASWKVVLGSYTKKNQAVPGALFLNLGKAYSQLGDNEQAILYLDEARFSEFNDPEIWEYLARIYKKKDNLSKEIDALETYQNDFPQGAKIQELQDRLFLTYVESENYDLAFDLWPQLGESTQAETSCLEAYFTVNKGLGNETKAFNLAQKLYAQNKKNILALEYLGTHYYKIAEKLYDTEMAIYNKKKSRSQYAKLLKALKRVTEGFRASVKYIEPLYKIDSKPIYAQYLANIYTRFDNKVKARYYRKLSEK
jgi:tetratricopeptide (TPR) repeat protein